MHIYAPWNIEINEHDAKVPLQDLLDHTTIRIIEQEDIITEAVQGKQENEKLSCTLICKWGFDGTSGHSEYKQKFSSPDISDQSIFCTTLVPLQMKSDNDTILWKNPVPSAVDQSISNFRQKHKYVRKKKHKWNRKLNTFNPRGGYSRIMVNGGPRL